jgi:hypothetical protein
VELKPNRPINGSTDQRINELANQRVNDAAAQPIGLIAGGGLLPILMARGIHAAGRKVACVGLRDQFDAELPGLCDQFGVAGIAKIGRWVRLLRGWGVHEAVMVGKVQKTQMYAPLLFLRYLPDWRGIRIWYVKTRSDRRTDRLLGALADDLASCGINLMDTTKYIPEHLADAGPMGRCKPAAASQGDIEFALPIVRRMGDLDIGQAIAVKDREVIAVEAIEGTDAMIQRAGQLCRAGKWVLVKLAKPRQDMRFDVPTVGVRTIEALQKAGATCLAVEAGKVILLDKPAFLSAADRAGIAVVGVK